MRKLAAVAGALVVAFAIAGCKKKSGGPGPGGWLVGDDGLMVNVDDEFNVVDEYDPPTDGDLHGIACRSAVEAYVVGDDGTFLRTVDAAASWEPIDVGTRARLRGVAAAATPTVAVAGDGLWLVSHDGGDTFATAATGAAWRSITIDAAGDIAFALDEDGGVWRADARTAPRRIATIDGALAIAMSHHTGRVAVVGLGGALWISDDIGATWTPIDLGAAYDLRDAWVAYDGRVVAVGAGAIVQLVDGALAIEAIGATLETVHVDARGIGIAAGADGAIVLSNDEGHTWSAIEARAPGHVRDLDQIDPFGHL
jgi:hypothetical protein